MKKYQKPLSFINEIPSDLITNTNLPSFSLELYVNNKVPGLTFVTDRALIILFLHHVVFGDAIQYCGIRYTLE